MSRLPIDRAPERRSPRAIAHDDIALVGRPARSEATRLSAIDAALYLRVSSSTFARSIERVVPSVVSGGRATYSIIDLDWWLARRFAGRKRQRQPRGGMPVVVPRLLDALEMLLGVQSYSVENAASVLRIEVARLDAALAVLERDGLLEVTARGEMGERWRSTVDDAGLAMLVARVREQAQVGGAAADVLETPLC